MHLGLRGYLFKHFQEKICYMNTFAYMFKTIEKVCRIKSLNLFSITSTTIHWASIMCQQLGSHRGYKGSTKVQDACLNQLVSEEEKRATTRNNVAGYPDSALITKALIPPSFWLTPPSFSGNYSWLQVTAGPRLCLPSWRQPISCDQSNLYGATEVWAPDPTLG